MKYDNRFRSLFLSCVRVTSGCWYWKRKPAKSGYGQITCRRICPVPMLAHRVAWEIDRGDIPDGKHVLHTCDNPLCVRPSHLFLGTQIDNNEDRHRKGRTASGNRNGARTRPDRNPFVRNGGSGLRGERHPMAKLSNQQVGSLVVDWIGSTKVRGVKASLAKKYGVSQTHVARLIRTASRPSGGRVR